MPLNQQTKSNQSMIKTGVNNLQYHKASCLLVFITRNKVNNLQ